MSDVEYQPSAHTPSSPVCSVCIANYNGMSTLADCIDSVLQQDCDFPVEIIMHDDASTDESVRFVKERYPEVSLLIGKENRGFCISNNRMADVARGEFLLLLNNDAALFPDALRKLHDRAGTQETPGILGLPQYQMQTGELLDRGSLLDPFLNPVPNLDKERRNVGMVIGACLWIPRTLWHKLGGFPEWFHTLTEDMYLCCTARLWGYPVEILPDSGFRHWVGKSLGGGKVIRQRLRTTLRRRVMSERNKTFLMYLSYPSLTLYALFPLHLLLLVLEGLVISAAKRDLRLWRDIYWNVFVELWRWRKTLWRERKRIQNMRRVSMARFFAPHVWTPYKLRMWLKHGLPHVE